jgi:hypothetical protein
MRKLTSSELTQSGFGTASEFISHGTGEDLTKEIQKDFRKHGSVEKFFYFWEGMFSKLGWQLTRDELLAIGMGDSLLEGQTDGDLVKNSKTSFLRILTRRESNNDIDLEPGCAIGSQQVGKQVHYVIKGTDGNILGWLPFGSVKSIKLVTGVAGVSEPHDGSESF